MRSEGFPRRFGLRRWTEGPLEGMMDLSADAETYRTRAQRILAAGTASALSFLVLLAAILLADIWSLAYPYFSAAATLPHDLPAVLCELALTVLFLALAFLAVLLLIQIWRYISVMLKRFENIEDLLGSPKTGPAGAIPQEEARTGMGMFNILGASSGFTGDIARNMPQVCRQLRFAKNVLVLMPLYSVFLVLGLPLVFGTDILPAGDTVFVILLTVLSLASLISGCMMRETGNFMEAVHARLGLLELIRTAPKPTIPGGATPADRLASYLEGQIGACNAAVGTGRFIIRHVSNECVLLAMETDSVPDLEMVKAFTADCNAELGKMAIRPPEGRFIILYVPQDGIPGDMDDDAEQHITTKPIMLGKGPGGANAETVIQIIIEDRGTYGMFPFVG